jgi:hypothetical protein
MRYRHLRRNELVRRPKLGLESAESLLQPGKRLSLAADRSRRCQPASEPGFAVDRRELPFGVVVIGPRRIGSRDTIPERHIQLDTRRIAWIGACINLLLDITVTADKR